MPLSISDECLPIALDESSIDAFIEVPFGHCFYGTTKGKKCHVIQGSSKGASGGIFDMGTIDDATDIPVLLYLERKQGATISYDGMLMISNSKRGCAIYQFYSYFPSDTIQEPTFHKPKFDCLKELPNLTVFDAILDSNKENLLILCDQGILCYNMSSERATLMFEDNLADIKIGRLMTVNTGLSYFLSSKSEIVEVDPGACSIRRTGVFAGFVEERSSACCTFEDSFILSSKDGKLWRFRTVDNRFKEIGLAPLGDIQCITATPNGTIYGVCGLDIGIFFKCGLIGKDAEALGAIATTLGAKRYGFEFSRMVTGSDGEIYLCEKDNGAHLWIYFPKY